MAPIDLIHSTLAVLDLAFEQIKVVRHTGLSHSVMGNLTLVAQVLSRHPVRVDSLDTAFKPVARLTHNVFLEEFNSLDNLKLVMRRGPWSFDNRSFVMVMIKNGDRPSSVDLS